VVGNVAVMLAQPSFAERPLLHLVDIGGDAVLPAVPLIGHTLVHDGEKEPVAERVAAKVVAAVRVENVESTGDRCTLVVVLARCRFDGGRLVLTEPGGECLPRALARLCLHLVLPVRSRCGPRGVAALRGHCWLATASATPGTACA